MKTKKVTRPRNYIEVTISCCFDKEHVMSYVCPVWPMDIITYPEQINKFSAAIDYAIGHYNLNSNDIVSVRACYRPAEYLPF